MSQTERVPNLTFGKVADTYNYIVNSQNAQIIGSKLSTVNCTTVRTQDIYISGHIYGGGGGGGGSTSLNDGSAGAPSLSFTSEPGLGLYRPSAGTVGVTGDLQVDNTITTPATKDLVLDPATGVIDFNHNSAKNVAGNPGDVIINDTAGVLTGEPQLQPVRGGTGVDTSASNGIPHVTGGTWSFAPITDPDFGTIVDFTATNLNADALNSAHQMDINVGATPADPTAFLTVRSQYPQAYVLDTGLNQWSTAIGGASPALSDPAKLSDASVGANSSRVEALETIGVPVTAPFLLQSFSYANAGFANGRLVHNYRASVSVIDNASNECATVSFTYGVKNISGTLSVLPGGTNGFNNVYISGDLTLQGLLAAAMGAGTLFVIVTDGLTGGIHLTVSGLAGKTLRWVGSFEITSVGF